jgi:immune inhibitor A
MDMKRSWVIPSILIFVAICCLGLFALGVGGGFIYLLNSSSGGSSNTFVFAPPTQTPQILRPTTQVNSDSKSQDVLNNISDETLQALEDTIVPANNLPDLALRLEGKENVPLIVSSTPASLSLGAQESFWVTNVDTNENFQISAELRSISEHVYFWVEKGVSADEKEIKNLVSTFENKIYPMNREFFGSEWSPGVDGDPHLYILYASGLGRSLAGYFSSADEYSPLAHEFSNAHEMFLLNADNIQLGSEYTYGVLAHEFQHMIHWYRDRNEETWLNEGFSELASFLNGYDGGGFDSAYVRDPDIQLNDWPTNPRQTPPHYGSAFLFLTYFLDRFGDQATKALVGEQENGMVSVDKVLSDLGERNPGTGKLLSGDDVFLDWTVATYLNDESVDQGHYFYHNDPNVPQPDPTETIQRCPQGDSTRDVHQYGVDYIRIACSGDFNLHFEGSTRVPILPVNPHSGEYAFWSNRSDESDMTLTRTFDFESLQGPITMSYWTWYDLEKDYDYLYVEASLDGENWQILTTPSGTLDDPSGNSYGWGYNGASGGWIQEHIDLSQYAGQRVQIRFEYITDAAVNGEGFLLDDIAVPEIDYFTDFEQDEGGWNAAGWVRIQNVLPQTYRLALISRGVTLSVRNLSLDPGNMIDIPLQIDGKVDEVVLVITGTSRFTRQKAAYQFRLDPE